MEYVAVSKNGKRVLVDPVHSAVATHLAGSPQLLVLVGEVIAHRELTEPEMRFEVDMERPVGMMDVVETSDADEILYAKQPNHSHYTRFVRDKQTEPTQFVSVMVRQRSDSPSEYELYCAWIGPMAPGVPGSEMETPESREFWAHHATVLHGQDIMPGTETTTCPW